jgi:hypothetical protein
MGPLFYVLQPLAAAISSPHEICEHTMRERSGKLDYRGKNELFSEKKKTLFARRAQGKYQSIMQWP